jgi:hypothetical protein
MAFATMVVKMQTWYSSGRLGFELLEPMFHIHISGVAIFSDTSLYLQELFANLRFGFISSATMGHKSDLSQFHMPKFHGLDDAAMHLKTCTATATACQTQVRSCNKNGEDKT